MNKYVARDKDGEAPPKDRMRRIVGALTCLQRSAGNSAVSERLDKQTLVAAEKGRPTHSELSLQRDACLIPDQASPYSHIGKTGAVGPGENFDANQRWVILSENFKGSKNKISINSTADEQVSDQSGKKLFDPTHLRPHAAEIDHILPREKGGGNTELNAQVLGGDENVSKGITYPHGGYSGARIYDPALQNSFTTVTSARHSGADMTTLDSTYSSWMKKLVKP